MKQRSIKKMPQPPEIFSAWESAEDIFHTFCRQLHERINYDFVKLVFFSHQDRIFDWQNLPQFKALTEEIIQHRLRFDESRNHRLEEIRRKYLPSEKRIPYFNHTRINTWKIKKGFYGLLLLGMSQDNGGRVDTDGTISEFLEGFGIQVYRFYRENSEEKNTLNGIIGRSSAIFKLKSLILKTSRVDYPLLITGESGSGKELVARAVHQVSPRKALPFVPVNAAAMPDHLIEAELFGYKKGSFTGAYEDKIGMIERSDKGTLFLDEIAELPGNVQVKLLRVLQEKEIRRIGETQIRKVDFRLITATNRNLDEMMQEGSFREDLFYRIQDLRIQVPPLRERREDIPLLVEHFFKKYTFKIKQNIELLHISEKLKYKNWPGNVRELESHIKRLITFYPEIYEEGAVVPESRKGLIELREEFEKNLIKETLHKTGWNKARTARELNLSRNYLLQLVKKYRLSR